MKFVTKANLNERKHELQNLDVSTMKASWPSDVEEVLAKIGDVATFNGHLQRTLFGNHGLLDRWGRFDMVENDAMLGRLSLLTEALVRLRNNEKGHQSEKMSL